jgi:hypothetical protein
MPSSLPLLVTGTAILSVGGSFVVLVPADGIYIGLLLALPGILLCLRWRRDRPRVK